MMVCSLKSAVGMSATIAPFLITRMRSHSFISSGISELKISTPTPSAA